MRQGFCQVQLKQFADAQKTLQPLADHEARLADQALLWIGKAQVGAADPGNPSAYEQAMKTAQNTFRTAADRANQLAGSDPDAKTRRGEILLELADAQQLSKQFGDSVNTYNQVLNEKLLPPREEEVVQDLAAAFHLAGNFAESDKVCERFRTSYPASPLLPGVLFRYAENAYFSALAADKLPNPADRQRETAKWMDETIKRYQAVVDKYPDSPNVNLARYGLGVAYYRKGDLEKARRPAGIGPAGRAQRRPGGRAVPAGRHHHPVGANEGRRRGGGRQAGGIDADGGRPAGRLRRRPAEQPAGGRRAAQARLLPSTAGGAAGPAARPGQGAGRRPRRLRAAASEIPEERSGSAGDF